MTDEPPPKGAVFRPGRRIDHAEAAKRFIAAPEHQAFHDERLWDLRVKRDRQARAIPEWEELRELASRIKDHTLTHLGHYLERFEAAARANGVTVHWAKDGADHNAIVLGILRDHGARTLIKSKSMLTDECGMREHLVANGIDITETDLGERIQQLDNEAPSHIVVPAVHKLRRDVSNVFARTLGTERGNDDIHYLAESQRRTTRPLILAADAGLTGANFAIAETGAIVTCTNEGNADLSANTPKLHIASVGLEKLVPRVADLGVFIRLLSRSALGSPITQYTSHFRAARAGASMHIVLVDNGRSARLGLDKFWTSLKCIRCGACMNTCPVYRRSGGLSYGFTYSGPLGLVIDPTFDRHKFSNLPFASTLNGSCTNVCPTKINLHEQIYAWREVMAEAHELPFAKRAAMRAAGAVLGNPTAYRAAIATADSALHGLPRFAAYNRLNAWGIGRENPAPPRETFHAWWAKNRGVDPPRSGGGGPPEELERAAPAVVDTKRLRADRPFRPVSHRSPSQLHAGTSATGGSRDAILAAVRANAPPPRPLPDVPMYDAGRDDNLFARFAEAFAGMGGTLLEPTPGDPLAAVRKRVAGAAVIVSRVAEIAGTRDLDLEAAPASLADVDVGVVRAAFGIAETGSVAFTEAELGINTLAYLAQHLVVLLDPADILVNLHHAYRRPEFETARYTVFHTGPSATADIEGVLIRGAQGVRSLALLPLDRRR